MKNVIENVVCIGIAIGILCGGGIFLNKKVDETVYYTKHASVGTVYYRDNTNVKFMKVAENTWVLSTLEDDKFIMTVSDEAVLEKRLGILYDLFGD